ncbi:phosphodiester glycosidase family protein [Pedobacter psychrodurus]|uniref:Phosphodiester glycosidase family protein n=1 Tax=Pedobacter psychrodurus TaxID=2530456 RepID=A0A4R0PZC9_9SPHI|nr:phosphodiester glycosidase family protein [Pedobacter psychrodurus]TCD28612.1 phosphodiester glycosidase family protein [Pedobacter psychrodurus]
MRLVTLITFLIFNFSFVSAQSDSIIFKKINWTKRRLAPGVVLKQAWFKEKNLFGSSQFISIIEVKQRKRNRFSLAYELQQKKTTSEFATEKHAVAAINGTFFDVKNGGSVDFIKSEGKIINENRLLAGASRARHQQAALVIKNGRMRIEKWDGSADWEKQLDGEEVMLTGPLLVQQSREVSLDTAGFNVLRHPRSAIGLKKDNRILLITIDGRNQNSAGMSLFELRKILPWLECKDGINLDGGGSTTLWEHRDGVVNHPSDGGKWSNENQRKVANVILLNR